MQEVRIIEELQGKNTNSGLCFEEEKSADSPQSNANKSGLRFESNAVGNGKLRFASKVVGSSKLRFEAHTEKMGNEQKYFGKNFLSKQAGQELDSQISKAADASENDAVRAADRERTIGQAGARYGKRYRRHRLATADKRLAKRQVKTQVKELKQEIKSRRHWERFGDELPKKFKKEKSRQKRKLMQKQIRQFSEKVVGKRAVSIATKVGKVAKVAAQAAAKAIGALISTIGWPVLGILLVFLLILGGAGFVMMLITNASVTTMSSYTSTDADIEAASVLATQLETGLEKEIAGLPSAWEWGHIDEFRYDLDEIGHDPFELMAYLSVTQPGFEMEPPSPIPDEVSRLHELRYNLILEEQVETRYYTVTSTDPVTGEVTETEEPYDYYSLNVILRSKSIVSVVQQALMTTPKSELWEWYQVLMETGGARQEVKNPFGTGRDWRGNVTSLYGYRLDPQNGKNLQLHRGLDIAAPEGTPLVAGLTGRVRFVGYDTTFGNYVIMEDDQGNTVQYAHCRAVLVGQGDLVEAGATLVAEVGNTGRSIGPHLHIEMKRNSQYLNPIYAIMYREESQ